MPWKMHWSVHVILHRNSIASYGYIGKRCIYIGKRVPMDFDGHFDGNMGCRKGGPFEVDRSTLGNLI